MRGVVGLAGLLVLVGCGGSTEPTTAPERPASTAAPASTEGQRLERKPCPTTAEPFEPTSATVPGVGRDLTVVAPPRASEHVPGTPPTDAVGKLQLAYDRDQGVQPGDRRGNVLLNAHTFPGGPEETALGNQLLAGLEEGGRIVLAGEGRTLCYRVTDRVEVDADEPFFRYYVDDGQPQVAIVVCSGDRLGPGVWTKRTVWFASPSA